MDTELAGAYDPVEQSEAGEPRCRARRALLLAGVLLLGAAALLAGRGGPAKAEALRAPAADVASLVALTPPLKCWTESVNTLMATPAVGINPVCVSYEYAGRRAHLTVENVSCAEMKAAPMVYSDVECCSEDLCNAKPDEIEVRCLEGDENLNNVLAFPSSTPMACLSYVFDGRTIYLVMGKDDCENVRASSFPGLTNMTDCCSTDMCNDV